MCSAMRATGLPAVQHYKICFMLRQSPSLIYKACYSCFPLSERLCLVCPLVFVLVCSTLVGRIDHLPLFAKSCCQLPVLGSDATFVNLKYLYE
jgi:hypothetical protein